ncbi:MAG: ferritin family protein [Nitrospirota bacterium]
MEQFSIKEVIEQAVQTEKLGYEFYTRMAIRFEENADLKKLFEALAGQELQHEKRFSGLKEKEGGEEPEGWDEVTQYLSAIVESEFFLGIGKPLPMLKEVKTTEEAFNYALGFEKDTILYYLALRDGVKDKETVDKIINEERGHIVWINNFKRRFVK